VNVAKILKPEKISQKQATFCLLDQRTFECHWKTVKTLAEYKQSPNNKIELLYFLGVGWLHRSFSGIRNTEIMDFWWGKKDWKKLPTLSTHDISTLMSNRFKHELGYRSSAAYPIYDRAAGNRVMYYMIHASDHAETPALMVRAHNRAVRSLPKETQTALEFGSDNIPLNVHVYTHCYEGGRGIVGAC
jgi:three-Cys-motif partner protein